MIDCFECKLTKASVQKFDKCIRDVQEKLCMGPVTAKLLALKVIPYFQVCSGPHAHATWAMSRRVALHIAMYQLAKLSMTCFGLQASVCLPEAPHHYPAGWVGLLCRLSSCVLCCWLVVCRSCPSPGREGFMLLGGADGGSCGAVKLSPQDAAVRILSSAEALHSQAARSHALGRC